jgi:hypothetical protein
MIHTGWQSRQTRPLCYAFIMCLFIMCFVQRMHKMIERTLKIFKEHESERVELAGHSWI